MILIEFFHTTAVSKTSSYSDRTQQTDTPRDTMLKHLTLFFFLLLPSYVFSAPKAEVWEYWQAHNSESQQTIDHSDWHLILQKYVQSETDGIHYFAYADVIEDDKKALAGYISGLEDITITNHNRSEQQAYWINLYNALTVELILRHYPVDSIRDIDISPGFFSSGPWQKKLLMIEGQTLSLDDIEHRILRPIWQDPRIHYAVNCASIGCPNLSQDAFTAENTDSLLTAGAIAYINHPRGVTIKGDELTVSSIYKWFKEDFGKSDTNVIAHLRQYSKTPLKEQLGTIKDIDDYQYDWNLNER